MTQTGERGMTGLLTTNSGYVIEEFLPALQGNQATRVYREMRDNDPVVGAELFAIDMLLRGVEWEVEENPDADDPEGDAQFLRECKDDMSHTWPDFISEVLSMLSFGWSFFEIVYKQRNGPQNEDDPNAPASSDYDDGKVGWRKFAVRAQESLARWVIDKNGGAQAMVQRAAPAYEEAIIPFNKGLLFRTTTYKGNPEGRSVLRNAYRPWFYKNRVEIVEGTGIERDLAGLPMAGVDPNILGANANDTDKALLKHIENIVQNVKRDRQEGIIWPNVYDEAGNKLYTFELLSSGGARQFDTNAIIERYDRRIAMTILADFILLGHENVGSFALSSDKTDLFAVALGAWLDSTEAVINNYGVKRLFKANNMDTKHLPRLKHGDIEDPDLQELVTYLSGLATLGMPLFPDDQLEQYLRRIGHLPKKAEEVVPGEDTSAEAQPTPNPTQPQPGNNGNGQGDAGDQANTQAGAGFRTKQPAGAGNGNRSG